MILIIDYRTAADTSQGGSTDISDSFIVPSRQAKLLACGSNPLFGGPERPVGRYPSWVDLRQPRENTPTGLMAIWIVISSGTGFSPVVVDPTVPLDCHFRVVPAFLLTWA